MLRSWLTRFTIYTDAPDGAAGGGPGTGDPGGALTPSPIPGAPATSAAGGGIAPAGTPPPADARPAYSYPEDRSRWVPPHRLQEVNGRLTTMEQALTNYQSRVRALMGVAEPEDPRRAELRTAMKEMFPGLAKFIDSPEMADRLLSGNFNGRDSIDGFQASYWGRHAAETVNDAVQQYAAAAGVTVEKLGATATAQMARQLQSYISADGSGGRREAYERRDPGFIKEFIADLTGFFVNPLRAATATTSAQNVQRAQSLPSSRGAAGVPPSGAAPTDRPKGKALHEMARQALLATTNT